ncbi:MAG TPA: phage holin family protein [Candidatus Limnocylindria bacterium]
MGWLVRAVVTAVGIAITAWILNTIAPGSMTWGHVDYGLGEAGKLLSLLFTAIVLGIVNAFVRPILVIISMPLTCLTLGLFIFVINALMLLLVSAIPQLGFQVDGFLTALVGSILISLVSGALSKVVH